MCSLDGCGSHRHMPPIEVPDDLRRAFLRGVASLPLAAVLADKALAQAAAGQLSSVSIPFGNNRSLPGALALPAAEKAPAVILIHEWWGLNDQMKAVAAELAKLGFVALAVELFGKVASDAEQARNL